jgi:hypothetical protein
VVAERVVVGFSHMTMSTNVSLTPVASSRNTMTASPRPVAGEDAEYLRRADDRTTVIEEVGVAAGWTDWSEVARFGVSARAHAVVLANVDSARGQSYRARRITPRRGICPGPDGAMQPLSARAEIVNR